MSGRLLLVTPTFHDYWQSIASAFTAQGHDVQVCRYDSRDSLVTKVHHKIRHELPELLGLSTAASERAYATGDAVAAVQGYRPDIVVTIKGDALDDPYWDAIATQGARHVLWLYDELRRTKHTHDSLTRAGAIATYSPLDAKSLAEQGFRTQMVPLAFDPGYPVESRSADSAVTFIGARYPQREKTLIDLAAAGVPVRAYGRQWSRHPFDRARTWQLSRPDLPTERDLTRRQAYGVMAASGATLNIHGDQDGFTMRTFEAAGVGALQLIDRADVESLYEPGVEVATYTSIEELIELCHRAQRDPLWANGIREAGARRTAADHTFAARVETLAAMWA